MVVPIATIDNHAYKNLVNLCPDIAQLKADEYRVLAAKSKAAPEIVIGCKKAENDPYAGVYEIQTKQGDNLLAAIIEVSHKDQTASAMLFETYKAGQKTVTEPTTEGRLQDLLNDLNRKGYKSPNTTQERQRG